MVLPIANVPLSVAGASTDGAEPETTVDDAENCVALGAIPLLAVTPTRTYFPISLEVKLYVSDVAVVVVAEPLIAEHAELHVAAADPTDAVQLYHWNT